MSNSDNKPNVASSEGARIRDIRKAKGLSMKQLAALIDGDVHFTTIAKIETGKMRLSTEWLRRIASALGVTPLEIVWDELSRNNVRAVPLFPSNPWPPESDANGEWLPLGHSPTMMGSDKSYAVAFAGPADNCTDEPLYQAVIDPAYNELYNGSPYAFACRGHVRFGVYRDSPPRFEQWFSDKPGVMLVGTEPFELLGRLVWLNRNMFS